MRTRLFVTIAGLLILSALVPVIVRNAYSHGVSTGGPGGFPFIRLDFEQFSTQAVNTGEVIKITGALESITSKRTFILTPYVSVDSGQPFSSFDVNGFPRRYYPFYDSEESWYFKIYSNLTNPVVLEPGQKINYEIRVYPQKAGIYHIHSYFISDYGVDRVGPGQTVQVNGSTMPTVGEVIGFYLPIAIGAATLIILVLRARKTANELGFGRTRKGVKMFFAVKSSLEAIWLSGLLVWLATAAYYVLQPLETRLIMVVAVTVAIAAITVSGYVTTVSGSRKLQNTYAIGAAAASSIFYFILYFGSPIQLFYLSYHFNLFLGAFGYNHNPLEISPLFLFIAMVTNAIIVALLLWKRKDAKLAGRSTNELVSRQ